MAVCELAVGLDAMQDGLHTRQVENIVHLVDLDRSRREEQMCCPLMTSREMAILAALNGLAD